MSNNYAELQGQTGAGRGNLEQRTKARTKPNINQMNVVPSSVYTYIYMVEIK